MPLLRSFAAVAAAILCLSGALAQASAVSRGTAAAASPVAEGDDFRKFQAAALAHIEARIRILQQARACIRRSGDVQGLMACHAEERRQTRELRQRDRQRLPAKELRPEEGPWK